VVRTEEVDRAAHRVRRAEQGRVGVEHPEVIQRSPAQRVPLDQIPLVVRGSLAELVPAGANAAGEVRHHASTVVDEELQLRIALEHTAEHDPGHER